MDDIMSKTKVFFPCAQYGHLGHSFRELVRIWNKEGFIDIEESPDGYVWMFSPGHTLLYDYHLVLEHESTPPFKFALYGNEIPSDIPNASPWILWPRHPTLMEKYYTESPKIIPRLRMWKSIFMGRVENQTQFKNRFQTGIDWSANIQNFWVSRGIQTPHHYSSADYLYNMQRSKFALLLPGNGPKCSRDIEAMACGAIPIVTPGVCTNYYNKWVEGKNYLLLKTEDDFEKIYDTPNDELEFIQKNNYAWYEENCSAAGSFNTTIKILKEMNLQNV